ncbi:helix-turn-helix transcriptional regulator [Vreelandella rituensis]|nr:helix-turn-helix transcriptional regulator [Halomonas rituensis]
MLAKDMGVSIQTASKWLNGHSSPAQEKWPRLAEICKVPLDWLLGTDHALPEQLKDYGAASDAERAGIAAGIVFPLLMRLVPDADKEVATRLVAHAYQELQMGRDERHIAGEVAAEMLHPPG